MNQCGAQISSRDAYIMENLYTWFGTAACANTCTCSLTEARPQLTLLFIASQNVGRILKSQVVILQTAQTWANAGVCGGLCACAVGGTFD